MITPHLEQQKVFQEVRSSVTVFPEEEEADLLQGLEGYHGSIQAGQDAKRGEACRTR
jgi:hypothetical protein